MGRSYHVNCMGGAIDLPSQQFKEAAVAVLESTQKQVFCAK